VHSKQSLFFEAQALRQTPEEFRMVAILKKGGLSAAHPGVAARRARIVRFLGKYGYIGVD
jgi:hypothetical protein